MKKISLIILFLILNACQNNLPIIHKFQNTNYNLITSSGKTVNFPNAYRGKIIVLAFIFTNCPDICPLTTNNMRLIQEKCKSEEIKNVQFVAISFDPQHDTPEVLKDYIRIRNFDTINWEFLTGNENVISNLLKETDVFAIPSDTTIVAGKEKVNFIHTDRIMLIDQDLQIRKKYPGSTIIIDEIVNDINKL